MQTRTITLGEVLALSSRDESHFYDRKSSKIDGKKVQKIAVGFANSDGGEFIIGISDDKDEPAPEQRWHGVEDIEALNPYLQVLFDITPSLDLRNEILRCGTKAGLCLRVQVEKSSEVHRLQTELYTNDTAHKPFL